MGWSVRLILMVVGLLASTAHLFAATKAVEAPPVTLTPDEREWVTRHPVLRVGVVTSWAPFSYFDPDGNLVGINIDILNLISQRTGLRFKPIPKKSWEDLAADWNELDMACSAPQTPEREQVAAFTEPYSAAPLVIIQREGTARFGSAAVVRHTKLALPRRQVMTQIAMKRLPSAPVIFAADQDECLQLVAKKNADAAIMNLYIASHYLNTHPNANLTITGVLTESELPLRMGVHRALDYAPAIAILNKGLASISQDEKDDIFALHLMFELQSQEHVDLLKKETTRVLAAVAIAGLLLALWNFFMRKEILARRKVEAELREANESMQIFSHSLSHDLRAPLRGINGLAQILKEESHERLKPEEQSYLDRIITSGSKMDRLIADVLDYSRATKSEWPMETVELDPLVHQLIEGFPAEQRPRFHIVSKLPSVLGHPTLLSQCLGNLLSNAVSFVPSDRTPNVVIRATQEGSEVTVFVEDNGIGIEPKDQKRIFKIFERAAPEDYKGTGIGLAVVAKAVERMGGSVGVESEVGKGSQFWIRLQKA